MRVVHSGLPPCVGPWVVDEAGVWRRWCVVPEGEAPVLAAETDNPDERAACDAEIVAHVVCDPMFVAQVLVGEVIQAGRVYVRPATDGDQGVEVDVGRYARVGNLR